MFLLRIGDTLTGPCIAPITPSSDPTRASESYSQSVDKIKVTITWGGRHAIFSFDMGSHHKVLQIRCPIHLHPTRRLYMYVARALQMPALYK